jgi:glycosyltransferase involved in cell wall biosynthesis
MDKKILLITRPIAPPWDEASKNFAYNLAINLPDFKFGLLTNGIMENMPENISQHPVYTSNNFNLWQKIRLVINLKKIGESYEIYHCLFTPTKLNSFLLRNLLGDKKPKTIQTIATLREDLFNNQEIGSLMLGNLLVTYSDYAKDKLNKLGFNNVKRVYPGIDLTYYSPASKDEDLLKKYELKATDFIVTFPGEYTRLGAIDNIVDMILQYRDTFRQNNIKFILACRLKNTQDILKKEEIMEKIKNHGAAGAVVFVNTFSDMAKLYNLTDAIIFPVREMHGKFDVPLTVIEAMACEKPVIISNLPTLSEFSNKENSVIIESGNQKQLKDAIIKLYGNKDFRELIGKNARKFVEEKFDIKNVAEQYKEIYLKI